MADTPAEQPPTKGPRANVPGKYYTLTPAQFSSPEEYRKAKEDAYNQWRDSLRTRDDYNNAARELLGQQTAGDRFQQYNVRDGIETVRNDAQQKGLSFDPDVQQGITDYSLGELGKIAGAFGGGLARGFKGRKPGEAPAAKPQPKPAEQKPDNVAIARRRKAKGLRKVHKGDFSTPPGQKPVAWTGGAPAMAKAKTLGTPMEGTAGGQSIGTFLGNKDDMPWEEKKQIWEAASDKWSKRAAEQIGPGGTVPVATNGGVVKPESIFNTVESPNFKAGGVTPEFK